MKGTKGTKGGPLANACVPREALSFFFVSFVSFVVK